MAWAEPIPGGFRGRYRDSAGKKQIVLDGGLPFERKRDAKEAAQEDEVKARRRASKSRTSAKITWGQWWDSIAPDRETGESDTARNERGYVEVHIRPQWGDTPLNQIERADVKKWVKKLRATKRKRGGGKLAASTVRRIYGIFATSINVAVDEEVLEVSPLAGIDLPEVPQQPKQYMDEAYLPSLAGLRSDYKRVVEFLYETGLRPSELGGLHVHNAHPDKGWVIVTDVLVRRKAVIRPWTKTKTWRRVPLTSRAAELLREALDGRDLTVGCGLEHTDGTKCESELAFRTERGNPVYPDNIRQRLDYMAERDGVEYKTPYSARRGFITWAAPGVDPYALQKIAGHSNERQTGGYHQLTPAELQRLRAARGETTAPTAVESAPRGSSGADPDFSTLRDATEQSEGSAG